jgi:hypothetical protein
MVDIKRSPSTFLSLSKALRDTTKKKSLPPYRSRARVVHLASTATHPSPTVEEVLDSTAVSHVLSVLV